MRVRGREVHLLRRASALLVGFVLAFHTVASALAGEVLTLRVGDQKGGNRSLLEIAGLDKDLPYKIEWFEFSSAAPIPVWEPFVSYSTLKDKSRIVADGVGLTPAIVFYVASEQAINTKRAALQDLVLRLEKAQFWSQSHVSVLAKKMSELTKLPEEVVLSAYKMQQPRGIQINDQAVEEVQGAADRAVRYGILSHRLNVEKAVDRTFRAFVAP